MVITEKGLERKIASLNSQLHRPATAFSRHGSTRVHHVGHVYLDCQPGIYNLAEIANPEGGIHVLVSGTRHTLSIWIDAYLLGVNLGFKEGVRACKK